MAWNCVNHSQPWTIQILPCLPKKNKKRNTQNVPSFLRLFVGKGKCKSLFLGQGTGRQCQSTRKKIVMRMMAMSTTLVVAEVPMKEQAEAQALAGVMIVSGAAATDGITVPRGSVASLRALIVDHKPPLLHPGLPRSLSSSPARMKVGSTTSKNPVYINFLIMFLHIKQNILEFLNTWCALLIWLCYAP